MKESNKIGFWSVFGIVTGAQIGSGVFMLPASLAPFGIYGIYGWLLSTIGAIALCSVFAFLCARFPKTGGPHVYVEKAFGPSAGFFCGWTYWIISWVSTPIVLITTVGYLSPFIPNGNATVYLILEILLLVMIMLINLRGVKAAGHAEFVLAVLKIVPLIAMPILALFYFNGEHITTASTVASLPLSKVLGQVALLTLWGFIGLECATTPAESVENPEKTIPKAIIIGTCCVAALYIANSIGIMGLISSTQLSQSSAPYTDAVQIVLGGNWHLVISVIAAIVCIGTVNAWVLTSGQIALGLAQDRLLPKFFQKQNKFDAPFVGIIISCCGVVPLLMLTADTNLAKQINIILDLSVIAFLFVYLGCSLSLLRCLIKEKKSPSIVQWIAGIIGAIFCVWVISETSLRSLMISSCFVISALPVYYLWYRRQPAQKTAYNFNS